MTRRNALCTLLLFMLPPASPWTTMAQFSRAGSMRWRFDDITVHAASGRQRRSDWFQGYDLSVIGPLVFPGLGSLRTAAAFSRGSDVNQAVNINAAQQQVLGGNASAELLSPRWRRFMRLSPNYSIQRLRQIGSPNASHTLTTTGWGFSAGLSPPRLPAVNISRQYNNVKDPFEFNPTDQRQTLRREDASYSLGPLRIRAEHENRMQEDRAALTAVPDEDTRRGSLEFNSYELNRGGLRSVSARSDFLRLASGGVSGQKSISSNVSLRSMDLMAASWTHAATYWNDFQKDLLSDSSVASHNLIANSNRAMGRGTFSSTLSGGFSSGRGGSSRNASAAPSLSLRFSDGRMSTTAGGSVGWSRSGNGDSFFNNALNGMLSLTPRPAGSLFVEGRTSGVEPIASAAGGGRTTLMGAGTGWRVLKGEFNARYDRTYQRDHASQGGSSSDQANIQGFMSPAERLHARGGCTLAWIHSRPGRRSSSRSLSLGMDYAFLSGIQISADATYIGAGRYNASLQSAYSVGKTNFNIKYQHQELTSPSAYSYLSVSLVRKL